MPRKSRKVFWSNQVTNNDCGYTTLEVNRRGSLGFIETKNKVVSLALNILLTDGEKNTSFTGTAVGNRGGHWSSSYSGVKVGTLWDLSHAKDIEEKTMLIQSIALASLQKLITYKVATDVSVTCTYKDGDVLLDIVIYGVGNEQTKILLKKAPLQNGWIWQQ